MVFFLFLLSKITRRYKIHYTEHWLTRGRLTRGRSYLFHHPSKGNCSESCFFCWTLHACHTINNCPIILKSSLLDSAPSQLSGGKKTKINYFHYRPFYNWSCPLVVFLAKNVQKMCALLKNRNLFLTYFLNDKWWNFGKN